MIRHGDPDRKGQAKDERKPIPRYVSLIHHAASCSTNSCWNPLPDVPSGDAEQFRDSSLISTIPELPGSGWLAAEPEATPQTRRLRPWGFLAVSPSHPSVFPHHGIQRITVEFSEKSPKLRLCCTFPPKEGAVNNADFRGGVTCLYDTQLLSACLHASVSGGRSRPEVRGMPEIPIAPPSHGTAPRVLRLAIVDAPDLDPRQAARPPGDDDPGEPKAAVPSAGRDHDGRCESKPGSAHRGFSQTTATQIVESGSPSGSPEAGGGLVNEGRRFSEDKPDGSSGGRAPGTGWAGLLTMEAGPLWRPSFRPTSGSIKPTTRRNWKRFAGACNEAAPLASRNGRRKSRNAWA